MSSSVPLSRQISNDTITSPTTGLKLLTLRTHTAAFSPNEVLIDPSLVPYAKPGSLLQIIPQSDIENESAAPSDRYIFRLGEETEKDVTTKYGNLQLSVVTEVGKAFRFLPGNNVAVSLVFRPLVLVNVRLMMLRWKLIMWRWLSRIYSWIVRICGDLLDHYEIRLFTSVNGSCLQDQFVLR